MKKLNCQENKFRDHRGLTSRQRKFCEMMAIGETASIAVKKAGYHVSSPQGYADKKLLNKAHIKAYIGELRDGISKTAIASAEEVLIYLTEVLRGNVTATKVTSKGILTLTPDHKTRLDAAKTLAKYHGLLVEKSISQNDTEIRIFFDQVTKGWSE